MCQMNQLLHIWRGVLLQEGGHLVPPCRDGAIVPPLHGTAVSVNSRQQSLQEVLAENQTVPAAGLEGEQGQRSCFRKARGNGEDAQKTVLLSD